MRRSIRMGCTLAALCYSLAACGDDDGGTNGNHANDNQNENQTGPVCGNGVPEGNEACDEGAANSDTAPDTCRTDCRQPRCGDGAVDPGRGEACDEGVANSDTEPDACRTTCVQPACGDGVIDGGDGELCDDGAANSDAPDAACRLDCTPRRCGDGIIDVVSGETCDDGNDDDGDGCSAGCTVEPDHVCVGEPSVCTCADYHRGPACATCSVLVVEGGGASPDGKTWATAFGAINQALLMASDQGPGCDVWVAEGTYHGYQFAITQSITLQSGVGLYGGFAGTEELLDARDPAAHPTILDGGNTWGGTEHVMAVVRGADDARLDGFVITGGDSGVHNDGTSPTIARCTFLGSPDHGSVGIHNQSSASPLITACRFSGHHRPAGAPIGGAIHNHQASPTIESCLFFDNEAPQGGAIGNSSANPLILSCTFADNRAISGNGGALYSLNSSPMVYNSILWGNEPDGIYSANGSVLPLCNLVQDTDDLTNGNVLADPLFADPASGDYRVTAGSPAIDTADCGTSDHAPLVDLVGQSWVDGDGNGTVLPDRGCLEYVP